MRLEPGLVHLEARWFQQPERLKEMRHEILRDPVPPLLFQQPERLKEMRRDNVREDFLNAIVSTA